LILPADLIVLDALVFLVKVVLLFLLLLYEIGLEMKIIVRAWRGGYPFVLLLFLFALLLLLLFVFVGSRLLRRLIRRLVLLHILKQYTNRHSNQ
jgi:hypothetical protein